MKVYNFVSINSIVNYVYMNHAYLICIV